MSEGTSAGDTPWADGGPAPGPGWLAVRRAAGQARFAAVGFPTSRTEAWKYSSVRRLVARPWAHAAAAEVGGAVEAALREVRIHAAAAELVLIDGHLVRSLSRAPAAELAAIGLSVCGLVEAVAGGGEPEDRALAEAHAGRLVDDADGFQALHAAFVQDGVIVRVAPGAAPSGIVHLISVSTGAKEAPIVAHALHLLSVGRLAALQWVETHVALGADGLVDSETRGVVAAGGQLGWHASNVGGGARIVRAEAEVARDGRWSGAVAWTGEGWTRSEVRVRLSEPGASCQLDGACLPGGDGHVDNHTVIEHAAPRCTTRETYRSVLAGRSRAVFDGTVIVRPGADGTDAVQACHDLLLSDDAEASAKPRLEIYADDVKCAHGTTVGRLDPAQLAYLRMRGIPEAEARRMLTEAFIEGVARGIAHDDAREALGARVEAALAGLFGGRR